MLKKNYPHIVNKLQNENMRNYFTKAIHYSKNLRHPLENKSAELDWESIWKFIVQTESDEIKTVIRQLTSDLNYFTAEQSMEPQTVQRKMK